MSDMFGGGAAEDAAEAARAEEKKRNKRINRGMTNINRTFDAQFNPEFFGGIEQAGLDYYMPQLDRQFEDAMRELTFALAGSGNLNSSLRGDRFARLQQDYDRAAQDVAARARQTADQRRGDVEASRSNLTAQLRASADPSAASQNALAQAGILSTLPTFEPLGDFFSGAASGIANRREANELARLQNRYLDFRNPTGGGSSSYVT